MALNKKIKDELHALKGLDSSSVYDEEDQKKKKAAQAKANASKARDALKSAVKSTPGTGLKNKAGTAVGTKSTRPTPRAQEKREEDNYLTRLRTELQGRLSDMRTNPRTIVDRYEDDESTRKRKDLLIGSMLNSDKLLGVDTDGVYDARQTVQNMKGLSAQTANNARRAEGWKAEAEGFGNTALGNFYGSAKDTLDRLAGQLDRAVTDLYSPANRRKEAEKESLFGGALQEAAGRLFSGGARNANAQEISTGNSANEAFIAGLEAKQKNGTITSAEERVLESLLKARAAYDSGDVTVYDDPEQLSNEYQDAMHAYLQTRENVDYMGGQAQGKIQQIRDDRTLSGALERMQEAGVSVEDYEAERKALYEDFMNAGTLKTLFGNYDMLSYSPEEYAAYRWTEENEPEHLDALKELLQYRDNEKDAEAYAKTVSENTNIVDATLQGLTGSLFSMLNTADIALQAVEKAGGTRDRIDYNRTGFVGQGGDAAVAAQAQKLAEKGSLSDWIKGLKGTWLGDKNLGDLYQIGVDSARSIINGLVFGGATGMATASQVYSGAFRDAKQRGATDDQAGLFATFQSAAEGLGEQVSFGSFQNLIVARGLDKKIGGKILLGLFQSAEEAGQEYVTEGMNVLADNLIMQELSEEEKSRQELMAYGYDPTTAAEIAREESNERMLDAALGGFIGGALRSGSSYAGQGIDAGMTAIDDYATGSAIQKNNNAGMMAQLMSEVSGQEVAPETSKRKLGKQQREFLDKAGEYLAGADDAVRDFVYGKISNIAQASQKPLEGTSQATKEKASKRLASMQQDENGASVGGESVTVQGFVKTASEDGDARLNIKRADGTLAEADIADVTFDSATAEVYSYAADMATPELANTFRMSIEPAQAANIEQVANGYSQAYDMAKAGFKEASIRSSNLTSALTDAQVSTVYKLGAEARRTAQLETIATAKQRAEANLGNKWKGGTATFDESVVVDALDNEQKPQIDMASAVTGAMGVNVVFFEGEADETGRYTRENGSYNRRTNTIYIDVNAGRYYKGDSPSQTALMRTLSHEVTHAIQRNSPESYAELRDMVVDILGDVKGATIEDLIDRKMAADSSLTTRDAAIDELVADACEKMLEDSDAAQRLMEAHPEAAKTFFQRVGELLNRIAEAIRAAFKGRKLSTEAQLVMKDVERYRKMVDLWTKGAMQTAEVSGKEQGEIADSETENAAISEETAAEGENITVEEDPYMQFQMRRPVEHAKGLVAVHNLTEEKLVAAMKLGGFPMPSIAIAKTSIGHQNFGPISLVFGSDTIDPKVNRKNKVYSADAWTPTFPRIEYQVNDAAERRVNSKLADLRRRIDPFFERDLQRLLYETEDLLNRYDGEEGLIKHVLDNYGMKAAYLEDTGRHADAVTRTKERIREVNPLRGEIYTAIAELVGLEGLRSRSLGEIRDMYGAQLEEIYPGSTKSAMRLSGILSNVIEYFENKDSAPETVTVTDAAATNRAVDDAVDMAAYERWVRELYDGIEAASGVYNGKDIYTSSGNRRSFASTHYPVSVENIAKAMYDAYGGKMKNVSAHYDAKTMRAVTARTFRSIDEIHKYEGRMRARTQEEADALTNDLNSRLNTLVSRIQTEKNAGRKLDLYEEMTQADQIGAILQEIAVKKFDPASLQNGLAAYGYQIGEQTAAELSKLITEISEMPVNIFEAKPERAVYFDEVRYAIVPDDMNADVRRQLEQLVPDVREYTEGDEARRLELLNEREDVQFQARNGVEFIEHKYFARLIDDIETQKPGGYLRVGAIQSGSVLAKVGLPENDLYFDVDKINRALDDHDDHITKEILKQVPVILRQPIAIAEARQENTVNVFGDVWISNSPVMVGIVVTKDRSGRNVINKVRTVHARHNYMARITDESVLYLNEDKKRTREWFQARGNDVPLGGTKFGFIRRIALSEDVVNPDIQKQTRDQTQTPEFERWFKGSKIVNEDGSPKLMYHGTPYGGFTVFKDWQYFTDNREYADVYHSPSASSIRGRYNDATNPMTYAVYLNVKKPFDTRDPKIRRIWQEEFYDNYSRTPLSDKGLPDWTDGIDLVEFIEDNEYDYDAIILDEGAVGGYGDDVKSRGISVVVRNSTQVKSATDNIGTFDPDDPDIQHQTRDEAISTRYALANMLETDAVSGEEVAWLRGYKNQFAKLEQLLGAIDQNKKIIRELMFKKGRTEEESVELQKARERNKILQDKVASIDEGLLKLEKADVIRSLVAREEQKIRDREAEKRREGIAKVRESQRNTAIRKNIQRRAKKLDRMLRQPSDKEHIPEGLRGAMLDMMEIFTGSEAAFGGAKADRERLYRAQREYEAMRGDEDNADLASRYDEDTADRLRQLADLMKDRKISDFNNAELTQLSMVIEHFEHLVRDQNDEFAQSRRKITEGYAEQIWQQTMTMKGRKENAITGNALVKALKHLGHANVIPPYFYKHLGGAMGKLGNDLLKAEGRYGVNMNKAAKRLDEIRRKYEHDKWATKRGDILKLETEIGDRLELTREQALGIWASAKRERLNTVQRAAHLRDGGVILEKSARKLGVKGQEINVTPTKISQRDIQQIDNWLTDQQKKYADEMVGYISRDMAALGNETSMELAGYRKFGEGYYYPYKTSSDFRRTELGKVENALIKNMGFTKSVVRNAKTPVVITDFSATVADHVNAMIMYNAFAVAQDQMMRVYDFKLDDSNSVKNLLRNAFGDEIPAYIEQHMRDLYGGVSPDRDAGPINWFISAHKKQAVLGSMSVVVQQPTALIRAMSQINLKYFVGQKAKGGFKEAMDYAGTAVIKDIGGFDSGVGRGATDWLNGKPKDWQNHKIKTGLDTVSDWAGLGAEYADKIAWSAIWKAVKREQADKYKVDINSPELKELAGERFDEVVRLTQVYDSVMTRSQLMRNKNLFWKMATSFMSEPTVTWNMMYDAGIEAFKNKKIGKAGGIIASVLVSTILTNLAKAVVTAARDDDDEEATYLERYVKNAAEGLVNDAVPFNYMPIVRDIYSKLQGYDVERADMGIINDMLAAGEVMLDEEKTPIAKVKSLVQMVSIMTGLPGKNIWRDVEAAFFNPAAPQSEARPGWLENALRTGVIDATPIGKWFNLNDSKANNADQMFEAILDGDTAVAEELREHLKVYNGADDDKAVDSLLRTRIKDGFITGEIDEDEALEMLTEHGGKRRNEAEDLISEWSYTRDNDGRKYDDMKDAFLAGEISAEEAIDARVTYGGAEEENSERTVQTWQYQKDTGYVYDDMRDDVLDGEISSADAIAYRVKYGGVKQETAEATVGKWEYERKYGYAYEDLREEHAAGNITSSEAIRAMTEYGGKDANDAYWEVTEWDYTNDGGEWDGKGTLLNDAFAGGNAAKVRSSMKQLLEHSNWKKPGNELASYVTDYYKPMFEAAGTEKQRQLQPVILDYIQMAYEAAGEEYFGDKYTLRYRSWLKIK